MTIDEAIKYAREVAENYNHKLVLNETGHPMHALGDRESARIERYVEQYTQIADWLEYYKNLKDLPNQYADNIYKNAYEKGRKDAFYVMQKNCKNSHFTYDIDSHCSGYNYCMLKGRDCMCCFENCDIMKEGAK